MSNDEVEPRDGRLRDLRLESQVRGTFADWKDDTNGVDEDDTNTAGTYYTAAQAKEAEQRRPLPARFTGIHRPACTFLELWRSGQRRLAAYRYVGCACGQAFVVRQTGGACRDPAGWDADLTQEASDARVHFRHPVIWRHLRVARGRCRTVQL